MSELSNKNQPKKLEDLFRDGMEEAKMAPSDQLWQRIEHDLDVQEKKFYQKRLAWFQQLAAACVLLLLMAAGYVVYDHQFQHQEESTATAQQKPGNSTPDKFAVNSPSEPDKIKNAPPATKNANTLAKAPTSVSNQVNTTGLPARRLTGNSLPDTENAPKKVTAQLRTTVPAAISLEDKSVKPQQNDEPTTLAEVTEMTTLPGLALQEQLPDVTKTATEPALPLNEQINALAIAKPEEDINPDNVDSVKQLPETTQVALVKDEPVPSKTPRWSFSGKYAPQYFNQNITLSQHQPATTSPAVHNNMVALNSNYTTYAQALDEFDNNTQSGYSFNTEAAVAYELNNNWAIEAGLAYTQNVASTHTSFIFNNAQVTARYAKEPLATNDFNSINNRSATGGGIPTTALVASLSSAPSTFTSSIVRTEPFTTQYRYQLIGMPVKVHYRTSRSRSFYYASVGFVTNLLVQAHIISDSPRVPNLKYAPNADSPFQNVQVAGVAAVGKGFTISKGLRIRAGVEATQYVSTLIDNSIYLSNRRGKPYSLGVAISSSYNFQ